MIVHNSSQSQKTTNDPPTNRGSFLKSPQYLLPNPSNNSGLVTGSGYDVWIDYLSMCGSGQMSKNKLLKIYEHYQDVCGEVFAETSGFGKGVSRYANGYISPSGCTFAYGMNEIKDENSAQLIPSVATVERGVVLEFQAQMTGKWMISSALLRSYNTLEIFDNPRRYRLMIPQSIFNKLTQDEDDGTFTPWIKYFKQYGIEFQSSYDDTVRYFYSDKLYHWHCTDSSLRRYEFLSDAIDDDEKRIMRWRFTAGGKYLSEHGVSKAIELSKFGRSYGGHETRVDGRIRDWNNLISPHVVYAWCNAGYVQHSSHINRLSPNYEPPRGTMQNYYDGGFIICGGFTSYIKSADKQLCIYQEPKKHSTYSTAIEARYADEFAESFMDKVHECDSEAAVNNFIAYQTLDIYDFGEFKILSKDEKQLVREQAYLEFDYDNKGLKNSIVKDGFSYLSRDTSDLDAKEIKKRSLKKLSQERRRYADKKVKEYSFVRLDCWQEYRDKVLAFVAQKNRYDVANNRFINRRLLKKYKSQTATIIERALKFVSRQCVRSLLAIAKVLGKQDFENYINLLLTSKDEDMNDVNFNYSVVDSYKVHQYYFRDCILNDLYLLRRDSIVDSLLDSKVYISPNELIASDITDKKTNISDADIIDEPDKMLPEIVLSVAKAIIIDIKNHGKLPINNRELRRNIIKKINVAETGVCTEKKEDLPGVISFLKMFLLCDRSKYFGDKIALIYPYKNNFVVGDNPYVKRDSDDGSEAYKFNASEVSKYAYNEESNYYDKSIRNYIDEQGNQRYLSESEITKKECLEKLKYKALNGVDRVLFSKYQMSTISVYNYVG